MQKLKYDFITIFLLYLEIIFVFYMGKIGYVHCRLFIKRQNYKVAEITVTARVQWK